MGVNSGGPALSTYLTVKGLRERAVDAKIVTFQVSDKTDKLISESSFICTLSSVDNSFGYSKEFKKYLLENEPCDIYHIQGVWQYPELIAAKVARRFKKPYIITTRGMLYPQDLAKGKLKKSVFLKLFLMKDLQKAACIHATCKEEMEHLRNLGVKSPIAVISNPINIIEKIGITELKDKLRIGYLGRVHPRKNIERLLYVWEKLQDKTDNGELVIIGDGDKEYMSFLKEETKRLKLKDIVFAGFLSGEEKENALNSLSYLVVPSDFENFGNIVTEALVREIPVIASKGTPWEELNTHQCGWWIENDVEILTQTIQEAINTSEEERKAMGQRGRKLMEESYSVEIVAKKMEQLYGWILDKGEKSEFVY
jgi:glycosyltransferase involved in cell wall biosynthesis